MSIDARLISTVFTESSPSGDDQYQVSWRCVSTKALNPYSAADMAELRTATCGYPLSALPGVTWSLSDLNSSLRLRSWKTQPVQQSESKVWDVSAVYSSQYTWAKATGLDMLVLPVEVNMEAGERMVQAWRTSSTPSSFGIPPYYIYGKSYDIGGDKIDEAGKPATVRVPTMDVRISLIQDVSNTSAGTLVTVYDKINTVQGKWNSLAFLHWGAYEVFCTSATVSHIRDEYYRITYNFRWDYWWDCVQIPEMDNDGHPKGDGTGHALNVFWQGLKRGTADHNIIFNTAPDPAVAKQMALEGCYLTYP
jgi:hypothetical protein